jgi:hypothetical protein
MVRVIDKYPARRLPPDLRGSDVPDDALVRVTVETIDDGAGASLDRLLAAVNELGREARANGLTPERLDEILKEADRAVR